MPLQNPELVNQNNHQSFIDFFSSSLMLKFFFFQENIDQQVITNKAKLFIGLNYMHLLYEPIVLLF
jgi:hypothetical protein